MTRIALILLMLAAIPAIGWADAPNVTGLFPAGGERGTEVTVRSVDARGSRRGRRRSGGERKPDVTVRLLGNVNAATVKLWADVPGIELTAAEGKDAVKLKVAESVPLGPHWVRFHTADGASGLLPFVVGDILEVSETEPNDTLEKAHVLAELPATVNGVLDKGGEVDTCAVNLAAGQTLVATLAAKQTLGSPMDGILQVVDAKGFVVEQNDDQRGFDSRVVFTAAKAGTYYVRAFAFPAAPDTTVRFSGAPSYIYRLTISAGPFLDRTIPCVVTANAPATVRAGGWNLPSPEAAVELPALSPGVQPVFAEAWDSTAKVLATPLPVVAEQEPNSAAQPLTFAAPGAAGGAIGEAGDVDGWKFTSLAGKKLTIRVAATALGSALDAVVAVFDAAGTKLVEVDDAALDEADVNIEFAVPKDGDYVVTVTDRFAHGGPEYWYALTVAETAPSVLLQTASDAFTVKADAPLEIAVTVERRAGFALPITITVSDLPEGVTAEAVVSGPEGDSSKAVKLVVKSTRTEAWTGPIRIAAKGDGLPAEVPARFLSPLTGEKLPHLWLTALPKP